VESGQSDEDSSTARTVAAGPTWHRQDERGEGSFRHYIHGAPGQDRSDVVDGWVQWTGRYHVRQPINAQPPADGLVSEGNGRGSMSESSEGRLHPHHSQEDHHHVDRQPVGGFSQLRRATDEASYNLDEDDLEHDYDGRYLHGGGLDCLEDEAFGSERASDDSDSDNPALIVDQLITDIMEDQKREDYLNQLLKLQQILHRQSKILDKVWNFAFATENI